MSATYAVQTNCRSCTTVLPMGYSTSEVWSIVEDRLRRMGEPGEHLLSIAEIDPQDDE